MSRPHKATVDYFPHFVNHGKTMFTIESKYGNDGYSFWFKMLEILGSTEHHYIDCNNIESWEFLLAKTRLSENIAIEILNLCSKLNSIDPKLWENKIIRSNNFIENLYAVYKRREVGVINNDDLLVLCMQKHPHSGVIVDINPQSRVKYSIEEESIKAWRTDFSVYMKECKAAFRKFSDDKEFIATQERFHPDVNIKESLVKAYNNFWGTEAGWNHKKSKKSKTIDWRQTITNAIDLNKVYYPKNGGHRD